MKLHDGKRVHFDHIPRSQDSPSYNPQGKSDKINVVLAINKLTTRKDDRFTHLQKQEITKSDDFKWSEGIDCNDLVELNGSLAVDVLLPSSTLDVELNILENNYQPEYLGSDREIIKPKILVVEERDNLRYRICSLLPRKNFQVIEAKDVNTAITLAQSQLPDLIICELRMLIIDDKDLVYLLGQSEITSKIPMLSMVACYNKIYADGEMILITDDENIEPLTKEKLLTEIAHRLNMAIS